MIESLFNMKKRYWMPAVILWAWCVAALVSSFKFVMVGLFFGAPFIFGLIGWNLYLLGKIEQLNCKKGCSNRRGGLRDE